MDALCHLACEVLPNGTVIAMDIDAGDRYVIQPSGGPEVPEVASDVADTEVLEVEPLSDEEYEVVDPREQILEARTIVMAGQVALGLAVQSIPSESGAVIIEERGNLRFVAVYGPMARRLQGARLSWGAGVAGVAMEQRKVIVLRDARGDPRHLGQVDELTGYVTEAIVVVPIASEAHVYGVIELLNPPGGGGYTGEEIERLQVLADLLAERLSR